MAAASLTRVLCVRQPQIISEVCRACCCLGMPGAWCTGDGRACALRFRRFGTGRVTRRCLFCQPLGLLGCGLVGTETLVRNRVCPYGAFV